MPLDKKDLKAIGDLLDTKTGKEIENLAAMTARGFEAASDELHSEISSLRTELKQEISGVRSELKADVQELRDDVLEIKTDVKILKKRTIEDDDALASENLKRKREIEGIKRGIGDLRLAHS